MHDELNDHIGELQSLNEMLVRQRDAAVFALVKLMRMMRGGMDLLADIEDALTGMDGHGFTS